MNNILFILGAGFSAPLGIPTISNFMQKAKDMLQSDSKKYGHFNDILGKVTSLSHAKNYAHCNLDNIEEVLSILDMEAFTSGEDYSPQFKNFICDVIKHYTPPLHIQVRTKDPSSWYHTLLGGSRENKSDHQRYYEFVSLLLNLHYISSGDGIHCIQHMDSDYRFAIVTLNYDIVIESLVGEINHRLHPEKQIQVASSFNGECNYFGTEYSLTIAKLHGSISGDIVPPTWNKARRKEIESAWKLARRLISAANYIVIVGYSMPQNDNYMRYLLINGLMHETNLKGICVVNNDNNISQRYNDIFDAKRLKVTGLDTVDYLKRVSIPGAKETSGSVIPCKEINLEAIVFE